ncbi:MAG TPA: DNA-binding response regulator, partial [Exiguobacterium sp.]|nr:DNA-binding response regulator [Exiguobacterium sp.]
DAVWGENYFGDRKTVDVNIRRLRQKIEENPAEPKFIETLWGHGYKWRNEE